MDEKDEKNSKNDKYTKGTKISRVRIVASRNGRDGGEDDVLATFPRNKGSGITIEGDCRLDVEIGGEWHKIWELRISSRYKRCDVKCGVE